jgi:hypothetical protein
VWIDQRGINTPQRSVDHARCGVTAFHVATIPDRRLS